MLNYKIILLKDRYFTTPLVADWGVDILNGIEDIILDATYYPICEFYYWLVKSIQYAIFLRKDFDWDRYYIFRLLQYKLKRTRERIVQNDNITDAKKIGKQIQKAEDYIQELMDDDFCKEEWKELGKKWGNYVFRKSKEYYGTTMERSKVKTEKDRKEYSKDVVRIARLDNRRTNKCLHNLFQHMEKHIMCWWE